MKLEYKKKRPWHNQNTGRNSEGNFPLKPHPAQRFQGASLAFPNIIDHRSLTRVPRMGYFYGLCHRSIPSGP